jgi:hypothetical protein
VRFKAVVGACALVLLGAAIAGAQDQKKLIGNWYVEVDKDRLTEGASKVLAATVQKGNALGIRCFSGKASIALGGKYKEGDVFGVKIRIDKNPVVNALGTTVSEQVLEIVLTKDLLRQLVGGKKYAFRVTGASATVFRVGNAKQVLADVVMECPFDE